MKLFSVLSFAVLLSVSNQTVAQSALASPRETQTAPSKAPSAQTPKTNNVPAIQVKRRSILLNFRIAEWQTLHSKDITEAQHTMETLQSIGCEVSGEQHGDHLDIRYRCVDWKPMKLDTEQQLGEWQSWLSEKRIDSLVLNPSPQTGLPTVSFRMPKSRSAHIHDMAKADDLRKTFNMLGCRVVTNKHNGHVDLTVQCKEWSTIALTTENSAQIWQDWLIQNGFETKHTHR